MTSRTQRAFWVDARFIVGIALVILAVFGVWLVIAAARATTPVAVAKEVIVPGTTVTADSVRWVDVSLGEAQRLYVTALDDTSVAQTTLQEGELIARASLASRAESDVTTVVISSASDVASTLGVGSVVEVWVSRNVDHQLAEASVLVPDATIARIRTSKTLGASGAVTIEVVIPREHVGAVLDAQATESALWVVPAGAR